MNDFLFLFAVQTDYYFLCNQLIPNWESRIPFIAFNTSEPSHQVVAGCEWYLILCAFRVWAFRGQCLVPGVRTYTHFKQIVSYPTIPVRIIDIVLLPI
jgi:hypothetical protein